MDLLVLGGWLLSLYLAHLRCKGYVEPIRFAIPFVAPVQLGAVMEIFEEKIH